MRFINFINHKFIPVNALVIILILSVFFVNAQPPQKALTLNEIISLLKTRDGKTKPAERNKNIIEAVRTKGIDFPFTAENQQAVKNAFASNELISALRAADRKNSSDRTNTRTAEKNKPPEPQNANVNADKTATRTLDDVIEQLIGEGNDARDERNYAASETAYRRVQSLNPSDFRAVYGMGNLYSDQHRWEEAEKAYRQAIVLESKTPEAKIALSFVLIQPVAGKNLSERYREAEVLARAAIQLDPGNAIAFCQLAAALEMQGQTGVETQEALQKAIKLDPNSALAYAHLGRLFFKAGKANESATAFKNAVRLATNAPEMILVAEIMQSQQPGAESESMLRLALEKDPKNLTALYLLSRILSNNGSFQEAEKFLKKSIEISPNSFVPFTLLSSLYIRHGFYDEAERALMKAVEMTASEERKTLARQFEAIGEGFTKTGKSKDSARVYQLASLLYKGNSPLNFSSPANDESAEKITPDAVKPPVSKPASDVETLISGGAIYGNALNLVKPMYPESARRLYVAGTVKVKVWIDEEGNVTEAKAVTGHPLLRQAAEKAARSSKFNPTFLSQQKVKVNGEIVYNFAVK